MEGEPWTMMANAVYSSYSLFISHCHHLVQKCTTLSVTPKLDLSRCGSN